MGSKSNDGWWPSKETEGSRGAKRRNNAEMEAETGVIPAQAEEGREPPELEEARKGPPERLWGGCDPVGTPISGSSLHRCQRK